MATKFWMVWREGTNQPVKAHESVNLAIQEAHRLSGANPGKQFFILESLARYVGEVTVCSTVCDDATDGHSS